MVLGCRSTEGGTGTSTKQPVLLNIITIGTTGGTCSGIWTIVATEGTSSTT